MYSNLKVISPLDYPDWDNLLLTNENYSFFQTALWARVLVDTYNYNPYYFVVIEDDKLKFLLPSMEVKSFLSHTRMVSLPFSDFCDPVTNESNNFDGFFRYLVDYAKTIHWNSIEFRGGAKLFDTTQQYMQAIGHSLTLTPDTVSIFKKFHLNTRRNIKKARRENVQVEMFHDFNAIEKFYKLQCVTRKRLGIPPQPFTFYKNIFHNVIEQNAGFIMLASHEDKVFAGALFFHLGNKALFKYGASDMKFKQLRGNNLIMWEAIRWYANNGYTNFNFGRTDLDGQGLRRFKLGWGCDEEKLNYYKFKLSEDCFIESDHRKYVFIHNVFKKLPTPVLRMIGAIVYKHLG